MKSKLEKIFKVEDFKNTNECKDVSNVETEKDLRFP